MGDETKTLDNFTDEQLRDELRHREEFAKQEAIPKPLETTRSLRPLRKACQEYIDAVATCGEAHFDLKQRIFGAAMVALFESGALDWLKHKGMG